MSSFPLSHPPARRPRFRPLRGALPAALLLLACGAPAVFAQGESLRFVREGVWLPGPSAMEEPRIDGRAVKALPLPGQRGVLLATRWRAGERLTVEWRTAAAGTPAGQPVEHRAEAVAPVSPQALVWLSLPWPPEPALHSGAEDPVTALAFSPDGRLLAAGSQGGSMAVFALEPGRRIWSAQRPGRVIKHVAFDPAGRRLYVGEQGAEGRIAAYDLTTDRAAPLWTFDAADWLGTSPPGDPASPYAWVTYPGTYRLVAVGEDLLAAVSRSWNEGGTRHARAALLRLDGAGGRVIWRFPAQGAVPALITWFDAAADEAVLPTQLPQGARSEPGTDPRSRLHVVALDSGRETLSEPIAPVAPYLVARFWRGIAFRPDGAAFAAASEDGRAWIYRRERGAWRVAWQQTLVEPIRLGSATLTATQGTLAATPDQVLIATGPTYAPQEYGGGGEPAASHPRSDTVFAYDWSGRAVWIWKLDNDLQGLVTDARGQWAALALGSESPQPPGRFQGLVLLRTEPGAERKSGRVAFRYPVAGAVAYGALAMTPDGRWLAFAETLRALAGDARRPGERRLWVLR